MQTINTYCNAANSQADIRRFELNDVATGHGCCTPSASMHHGSPMVSVRPASASPDAVRPAVAVVQAPKPALLKPEWLDATPVEPPARAWAALVIGHALSS